jgi:hypothetical protein
VFWILAMGIHSIVTDKQGGTQTSQKTPFASFTYHKRI